MYWVERFTTSRIMKRNTKGQITKLIEGKFGFIGWLFTTKNGTLYFTQSNKLHRVLPDGNLETVATNFESKSTDFTMMGRNYNSYGIWTDKADNIYISMIDSKNVIRIGANGKSETIITTNGLWTICSGIFENDGDLWVLEYSTTNQVRAREIKRSELAGGPAIATTRTSPHLVATIFTGLTIAILVLTAKLIVDKRRKQIYLAN